MKTAAPPRPPRPRPPSARPTAPQPDARQTNARQTKAHQDDAGYPKRGRPAPTRKPARTPPKRPTSPRRPAGSSPRRRLIGLLVVMILGALTVSVRLTQVQGTSAARYAKVGESQRLRRLDLPADRGAIFDRNGRDLALTVPRTTITANPHLITDPLAAAQALSPIVGVDELKLRDVLSQDKAFVYVARRVTDDVAAAVKALGLPGIEYTQEPTRVLPGGDLASPVLGMVGTDNEGLSGLEVQFDKLLRGSPGWRLVETDPTGTPIAGGERESHSSAQGDDLVLTIDRSLQYETERDLAAEITAAHAKGGMAIVMQTKTGEILSMADLTTRPDGTVGPSPKNTALTNVYEPGSVNKLITISGALEEHVIKPEDHFTVPDHIRVADATFGDAEPHPSQDWSVTDVVANSSNVGTIMIGQKLGKQNLDHYMRAYGFGKKTGLGFPGESAGLLLDPSQYSGTSMATIPIGQGIAVTALQLISAYNTIANGGVYVAPKLVKATIDGSGSEHATAASGTHRVVSATTAKQMTAMLAEVVRVGTATRAAIDGYTVAGKTGTARKPLEGARGYKAGAYMSSFAGFVPAENPQLTALVVLDEPTPIFGGLVSAPVFAQIAQYGLREFMIPPPDVPLAPVPKTDPNAAKAVGEVGANTTAPAPVPVTSSSVPTTLAPKPSSQP